MLLPRLSGFDPCVKLYLVEHPTLANAVGGNVGSFDPIVDGLIGYG
jgi:hypothetical protein